MTGFSRRLDTALFLLLLVNAVTPFQPLGTPVPAKGILPSDYQLEDNAMMNMGRIGESIANDNDDVDDDNVDYQMKLREANKAVEAAEAARKKLLLTNKSARPLPPPNSLARLEFTDAGTLNIAIPPKGLGSSSLFTGAFSLAWFSAIIPATFASGGASLLFMLPFWAAGGIVAKNAVFDPFVSGNLSVGEFYWSVSNNYAGKPINQREGPTEQLRGAKPEVVAIVNDVPQAELKLYTDTGMTAFGLGLSMEELEYLSGEINHHLSQLRNKQTD
eukprot:scaffold1784_cov116-Cylindrotheca_fusiformis.AAC.12